MNNNITINLHIPKTEQLSSLKARVLSEELENINKKNPPKEESVSIATTYSLIRNDNIEVGFFIRNTFSKNISLEYVRLGLQNSEDKIIYNQIVNFKDIGIIPPYSAIPSTIKFQLLEEIKKQKLENLKLVFLSTKELNAFKSVETDLEEVSLDLSFEEEKELREFKNNLDMLQKDTLSTALFKADKLDDGGVELSILFRNGFDSEIKIEKLPITIENFNGISICKYVFQDTNSIVKVGPAKAKLVKLKIDKSNIYNTVFDLDRCKILFQ